LDITDFERQLLVRNLPVFVCVAGVTLQKPAIDDFACQLFDLQGRVKPSLEAV
jgi:hypothetical protein